MRIIALCFTERCWESIDETVGGRVKRSRTTQEDSQQMGKSENAGGFIDSGCDKKSCWTTLLSGYKEATLWLSPEGHGAPRGRLCEPGSSKNSLWVETATVLQDKHEVACSEWDDIYSSNHIQRPLKTNTPTLLQTTCSAMHWITFKRAEAVMDADSWAIHLLFDLTPSHIVVVARWVNINTSPCGIFVNNNVLWVYQQYTVDCRCHDKSVLWMRRSEDKKACLQQPGCKCTNYLSVNSD